MKKPVGEQELAVLRYVAEHGPVTVGEVAERFGEPQGLARSTILTVMERSDRDEERAREEEQLAAVAGFSPPEPALQQIAAEIDLDFFPLLVLHTRQGFLADPIYGGNRNRAGWDVIGFPGPPSLVEAHAGRYSTLPYFTETAKASAEKASR